MLPCAKEYKTIQTAERSSADNVVFKSGKEQYKFVQERYILKNKSPVFKSHADYIAWKRMNAQLHSD